MGVDLFFSTASMMTVMHSPNVRNISVGEQGQQKHHRMSE